MDPKRSELGSFTRVHIGVAAVVGLAAIVATYLRLRYGVSMEDEPFYLTVPYRFVMGDRPYLDEWNPKQGFGLLLYLPVRLFLALNDGTEGIFLFSRRLYFFFTLGTTVAFWAVLRRYTDRTLAALVALTYLVYVPLGLPALSYNTFAMAFFSFGCLTLFRSVESARRGYFLAGTLHAVAFLVYPPLILIFFAVALLIWLVHDRRSWKPVIHYLAGVSLAGIVVLAFAGGDLRFLLKLRSLLTLEPGHVKNYEFSRYFGMIFKLADHVKWPFIPLALLLGVGFWKRPRLTATLTPALLPFLAVLAHPRLSNVQYWWHFQVLGLAAPLFLIPLGQQRWARHLLLFLWLPSVGLGIVIAACSGVGSINLGMGFTIASLVTSAFVVEAFRQANPWPSGATSWLPVWYVGSTLLTFVAYQKWQSPEDVHSLYSLDRTVASGPFKGLVTNDKRIAQLERYEKILAPLRNGADRITILPFPGPGYLFAQGRPKVTSVWLPGCPAELLEECRRYYSDPGKQADVVVLLEKLENKKLLNMDFYPQLLSTDYRHWRTEDGVTLYRRR